MNDKYSCDLEFWSKPNAINSYWAGFVCADGYLSKTKYNFVLGLGSQDLNHLQRFKNDNNFGIVPGKMNRVPPINLSEYLKWCYLIGYIDGDGSIFVDKRPKQTLLKIVISSGISKVLDWIRNLIESKFNKNLARTVIHHKFVKKYGCQHYNVLGIRACLMLQFLRKFDVPKLERKWNTQSITNEMQEKLAKYPNLTRYPISNRI